VSRECWGPCSEYIAITPCSGRGHTRFEYTRVEHVEAHVPDAGRPTIQTCGDPTIRVMGDPHSDDQLPSILRRTNPHPYYKYPQTSRYALVEIILIKAFIHSIHEKLT